MKKKKVSVINFAESDFFFFSFSVFEFKSDKIFLHDCAGSVVFYVPQSDTMFLKNSQKSLTIYPNFLKYTYQIENQTRILTHSQKFSFFPLQSTLLNFGFFSFLLSGFPFISFHFFIFFLGNSTSYKLFIIRVVYFLLR